MLHNDRATINQMVQAEMGHESIEHIRILDAQGIVQVSSESSDVGRRFDYTEPTCQLCHTGGARPSNQTAIVASRDNRETLLNVNLIRNQPQCESCHDPQNRVLGIMIIEAPMIDLNNQLTAMDWRIALSALASLGLLIVLLILALRRLVIRPLSELSRGMAEIRRGNLDYPVKSLGHDELGDLAGAFDSMREQLKFSRKETQRRTQELAMLNDLALGMSQVVDLQKILELALDTVVNRLGMQAGGIYLFDEDTGRFTMRACRGISEAQCQEIERRREQPSGDVSRQAA
jgi:HAMP domain-containing protein